MTNNKQKKEIEASESTTTYHKQSQGEYTRQANHRQ